MSKVLHAFLSLRTLLGPGHRSKYFLPNNRSCKDSPLHEQQRYFHATEEHGGKYKEPKSSQWTY